MKKWEAKVFDCIKNENTYNKIKKLFNDYNEDINLWDCDFKKTYGYGICDISGVENGKQMKYYEKLLNHSHMLY